MKWSEFFGRRFMESEVPADLSELQNNAQIQENSNLQSQQNVEDGTSGSAQTSQQINSTNSDAQNQQFDALNAKIRELEEANRKLVMRGSLQEQPHQKTDEEIILDLCVNRRRYGTENNTVTDTSAS